MGTEKEALVTNFFRAQNQKGAQLNVSSISGLCTIPVQTINVVYHPNGSLQSIVRISGMVSPQSKLGMCWMYNSMIICGLMDNHLQSHIGCTMASSHSINFVYHP